MIPRGALHIIVVTIMLGLSFNSHVASAFLTAPNKNQDTPPISVAVPADKEDILPPAIVDRKDWNAKKPKGIMKKHRPVCITVHHTAKRRNKKASLEEKMRNLQYFAQNPYRFPNGVKKPAWPDVPYHFYIDFKGDIAAGRDIDYVGDTNTRYNPQGHILVTLEGNFEIEQPTSQQLKATINLIFWLVKTYNISPDKIKGHNDYAATACPGKHLNVEKIENEVRNRLVH